MKQVDFLILWGTALILGFVIGTNKPSTSWCKSSQGWYRGVYGWVYDCNGRGVDLTDVPGEVDPTDAYMREYDRAIDWRPPMLFSANDPNSGIATNPNKTESLILHGQEVARFTDEPRHHLIWAKCADGRELTCGVEDVPPAKMLEELPGGKPMLIPRKDDCCTLTITGNGQDGKMLYCPPGCKPDLFGDSGGKIIGFNNNGQEATVCENGVCSVMPIVRELPKKARKR